MTNTHLTGGRVMHPQSVRTILLEEEAVWQFQIVQETTTSLRVALVAADSADRRRISERLAARFASLFGPEIAVELAFVNAIDRAATGGKFRVVVSLSQQSGRRARSGAGDE